MELIPEILNEVGLSELKLSTGEKIIVKDQLKSSIADKNYLQAYQNMIAAEGGDADAKEKVDGLFKSKAIIENPDDQILNNLIEKQVPYDLKREIHWQTLQKYCKNKLDRGEKIPEGISVFTYSETVIK